MALPELADLVVDLRFNFAAQLLARLLAGDCGGDLHGRRAYTCARGPRPRVLRHLRLGAHRSAGADGPARAPRRRAAALRLRRGDTAANAAFDGGPGRASRGLPDALPRRPLPRPAGDAQDVRAPRAGARPDRLRPARAA